MNDDVRIKYGENNKVLNPWYMSAWEQPAGSQPKLHGADSSFHAVMEKLLNQGDFPMGITIRQYKDILTLYGVVDRYCLDGVGSLRVEP